MNLFIFQWMVKFRQHFSHLCGKRQEERIKLNSSEENNVPKYGVYSTRFKIYYNVIEIILKSCTGLKKQFIKSNLFVVNGDSRRK